MNMEAQYLCGHTIKRCWPNEHEQEQREQRLAWRSHVETRQCPRCAAEQQEREERKQSRRAARLRTYVETLFTLQLWAA